MITAQSAPPWTHNPVAANQVGRLPMHMEELCESCNSEPDVRKRSLLRRLKCLTDLLLALEDVESPIPNRFPRLGRLGILEHDAVQGTVVGDTRASQPRPRRSRKAREEEGKHALGLCCERSTRFKVRLDGFRRRTSGVTCELFTPPATVPTSSGDKRVLIGETAAPPSFTRACEFTAPPAAISSSSSSSCFRRRSRGSGPCSALMAVSVIVAAVVAPSRWRGRPSFVRVTPPVLVVGSAVPISSCITTVVRPSPIIAVVVVARASACAAVSG